MFENFDKLTLNITYICSHCTLMWNACCQMFVHLRLFSGKIMTYNFCLQHLLPPQHHHPPQQHQLLPQVSLTHKSLHFRQSLMEIFHCVHKQRSITSHAMTRMLVLNIIFDKCVLFDKIFKSSYRRDTYNLYVIDEPFFKSSFTFISHLSNVL